MAVLSRDDFFNRLNDYVGADNRDETISFVEDMTDTYNDLERRNTDENWEQRYRELDAAWRDRYKRRFFSGDTASIQSEIISEDETDSAEEITIDDLFKEEKGE